MNFSFTDSHFLRFFPAFLAAYVLGLAGTWLSIRLARRLRKLDVPGHRSSHDAPMPRLGGLGIALGLIAPVAYFYSAGFPERYELALVQGGLAALILGLTDDIRSLPPWAKLGLQCLCAIIPAALGLHFEQIPGPHAQAIGLGRWGPVLTVLWIVFFMNAFNFMDGIDGLAGSFGILAALAMAFPFLILAQLAPHASTHVLVMVALAGTLLGFLRFNTSRPCRTFMGDGGSQMVGFVLALTLVALPASLIPAALLAFWPFIYDVLFTLAVRAIRRRNLFEAHRDHLYQRLLRSGLTHRQVLARQMMLNAACFAASLHASHGYWRTGSQRPFLAAFAAVLAATAVYTAYAITRGAKRANAAGANPAHPSHKRAGIGLLEALALVALVFLVIAMLIPWRSRAALRSGVVRARADVVRMSAALDIYHLDHGAYPPSVASAQQTAIPPEIYGPQYRPPLVSHKKALRPLTTPIAYLPSVQFDAPFIAQAWEITEAEQSSRAFCYWYNNYSDFYQTARGSVAPIPREGFLVLAFGPNTYGIGGISAPYRDILPSQISIPAFNRPSVAHVYDPTNGLNSYGNIMRFGGKLGLEEGVPYYPFGTE